ncbi:C-type lectin 37Da-like [Sitodiplosis mosellana]|uniref:C-type lectin 37Da-like n=1 Tax=Sitodiplosis mosellana TaxID=263140 RepID=UPI002443D487|nr:C-type lectin 37Da-like [Sitodiplosis mosellana]XP_055312918.1 C-type lectin 37Da-like [Sitodiplosis mosellana]
MKLHLVLAIVLLEIVSIFGANPKIISPVGKSYHIPTVKSNWFKANSHCYNIGMRLVRISSSEEHNAVVKVIKASGYKYDNFWTSATELGNIGYYWFHSGQNLQFKKWASGQPGGKDEHCMQLSRYTNFEWHDYPCTEVTRFVCETT